MNEDTAEIGEFGEQLGQGRDSNARFQYKLVKGGFSRLDGLQCGRGGGEVPRGEMGATWFAPPCLSSGPSKRKVGKALLATNVWHPYVCEE